MRKLVIVVSLLLMIPGVASAGGGGNISSCPGFSTGTTISMLDSCFSGTAHFAPSETTLTISNDGELPHTFTAVDGSFDSGQLQPGQTFEITIDKPGVLQVFCALHGSAEGQGMAGVLVVGEAEPLPVSAPLNLAAIKQAVAEENQTLFEALGRQADSIENLNATQAGLIGSLGRVDNATEAVSSQAPTIVTVPAEPDAGAFWIPLAVGTAVGLALAALLVADRSRRGRGSVRTSESLEPSLESRPGEA